MKNRCRIGGIFSYSYFSLLCAEAKTHEKKIYFLLENSRFDEGEMKIIKSHVDTLIMYWINVIWV